MEIHLIYGSLGVKNFVFPIANSYTKNSIIYYQKANKFDHLELENVIELPTWFNLKISLTTNVLLFIPSLYYMYRILSKNKNVKFIPHMTTYSFFPLVIACLAGVKNRIYFNHGFAHIGSKGFVKYFLYFLEFINCLLSSKVVTVSPSHLKFVNKGPIAKVSTIKSIRPGSCCGINKSRIINKNELDKKIDSLKIACNDVFITYIGRAHNRKGFPYILKLFEHLRLISPNRNLILQLIGINHKQVYKSTFKSRNLDYIDVVPYTDNVDNYLKKSVFTILPSAREGFGYALLEGAASGNALACFDIIGPDSLIINNFNGITLPLGTSYKVFADKIADIICDQNQISEMMINSRSSSFDFERSKVLKSLREII